MAITTQDPILAWQRIANSVRNLKPYIQTELNAVKSYLVQQGGNPKLLVVPFGLLSDAETVISDVACKLYAVVLVKQGAATATFSKLTDSASASSDAASELRLWSNAVGQEQVATWAQGLPFASGITMQGNTTANGGTTSGANACVGFCVIGDA